MCDPRHILKNGGGIKPGIFPPSHIAKAGLSLLRRRHLTADEIKMHADAIASHNTKDKAVGIIDCEAGPIRALVEADGIRSVCLFDDPVKDDARLPDNPAHASLIAAREMPEEDINELRDRLLDVFSQLKRFSE